MFEDIKKVLDFLFQHGKINEQQLQALSVHYNNVIMSNNFDLDVIKNDLKKLFESNSYVNNILVNNSVINNNLEAKSSTNNSEVKDNLEASTSVTEEKKIELVDVYDFKRGEQDYIKLTYSDGSVRILENNLVNNGQPCKGEDIFGVLKEKYRNQDITRIFHEFTRDAIEVKLHDFKDLNNKNYYDSLSQAEQQLVSIVSSQYPDKKVLSGPSNNMFVIREFGKPDLLVQVESLNGVYQVRPIIGISVNDDVSEVVDSQASEGFSYSKRIRKPFSPIDFNTDSETQKAGFMTLLLFIFLAGISSGIIFMIILNFIA